MSTHEHIPMKTLEFIESLFLTIVSTFFGFVLIEYIMYALGRAQVVSDFIIVLVILLSSTVFVLLLRPFKRKSAFPQIDTYIEQMMKSCKEDRAKTEFIINIIQMCDAIDGIGFWYKDDKDRYIFADETLRRLLLGNNELTDIVGKSDREITVGTANGSIPADNSITPEDLPNLPDLMHLHPSNVTDFVVRSLRVPCRFHEEHDGMIFDVWKSPIIDVHGCLVGTVGVFFHVRDNFDEYYDKLQRLQERGNAIKIDSTPHIFIERSLFECTGGGDGRYA